MGEPDPRVTALGGRLAPVDALRGVVMILMALDHTRDFLQDMSVDAMDPAVTTVPLFLSRWVTHFCAPIFVFLAGASAFLMGSVRKSRTAGELASFLISRGAFLMILELTAVRLGLTFTWSLDGMFLQVIWAIGLSLVFLGILIALGVPARWIGVLGAVIVFGHNALDLLNGPAPDAFDDGKPAGNLLMTLLFRPGPLPLAPGVTWYEAYPVLPWFGVMALGYAFGEVLLHERWTRARITAILGLAMTAAFIALRAKVSYGDPRPFQAQDSIIKSIMAFLNCAKYPPSLLYVLMTMGPGLLLLSVLDFTEGEIAFHGGQASQFRQALVTFGRVPLFFYLLQWPLIRVVTTLFRAMTGEHVHWLWSPFREPSSHGFDLSVVYVVWIAVVALLFLPCCWYADLKQRRYREWKWLSYL